MSRTSRLFPLLIISAFFATASVTTSSSQGGQQAAQGQQGQQATAARQASGDGGLTPAPNRRADEGRGPFKTLVAA